MPSLMPVKQNIISRFFYSASKIHFNESSDDYLTRFKILTNPGRIFTFSINKIPVIADMFPSALHLLKMKNPEKLHLIQQDGTTQ